MIDNTNLRGELPAKRTNIDNSKIHEYLIHMQFAMVKVAEKSKNKRNSPKPQIKKENRDGITFFTNDLIWTIS